MRFFRLLRVGFAAIALLALAVSWFANVHASELPATAKELSDLSPAALAATKDGKTIFVACATGNRILRVELLTRKVVASLVMPASPSGLCLAPDDSRLFITCSAPESQVVVVELPQERIVAQIPVGHTATAPVLSPDGRSLFVCNRFNDNVSVIDVRTRAEVRRIPVQREPAAAAITLDGKFLLVANFLPAGPANARSVAAVVSVLDLSRGKVTKELRLPDGSGSLNDIRIAPNGKHAVVTHIRSRYRLPATLLERGWMNTNAQTIIDLETLEILNTVLLDDPREGAANPWGVAWSADSSELIITHAGTHEISVIDFAMVLTKLQALPTALDDPRPADYGPAARVQSEVPDDLSFLAGIRKRIKLPAGDFGPRAVTLVGTQVFTANYFSDTLSIVDLGAEQAKAESIFLGAKATLSLARKGEL
jgi:YVTN family beta-propeller protein